MKKREEKDLRYKLIMYICRFFYLCVNVINSLLQMKKREEKDSSYKHIMYICRFFSLCVCVCVCVL